MKYTWTKNTSSQVYKDALSIRKVVFVKEQQVPADLELDDLEEESLHVVGYKNNKPVTTARIYETKPNVFKIQRVAVIKDARNLGYGLHIMQEIERYSKEINAETLKLNSQDQAIPFYEKIGFQAYGKGFMDAGIPHHTMSKKLN